MPRITQSFARGTLLLTFSAIGAGGALAQASVSGTTAYVSVSGAITFGFAPLPESAPAQTGIDALSILPPGSNVAPVARPLVDSVWLASPTFRRQCARLVEAGVSVTLTLDYPRQSTAANAETTITRNPPMEAHIRLRSADSRAAEYLAHEIEHILEQIDQIDLKSAVAHRVHGATTGLSAEAFETSRATAVGRIVARELEHRHDRR